MAESTLVGARDVELPDWRWLLGALHARFAIPSFSDGANFATAIAELADNADHHPDIDLRYSVVLVRLRSHDVGGVTERDLRLAASISALAAERGLAAQPEGINVVELALDTASMESVKPFWAAVLALREADDEIVDVDGARPTLWFQPTDSQAADRQRFHLDISVPKERASERIAAAVAAGGRVVDDHLPTFTVLEDPEGNRVCVCSPLGTAADAT